LVENQHITCFQSGFRPGDSTTNQLLHLTNIFGKAIDDGKEIRVMFFDISKAFDRVWHAGLIYKLQKIGIHDPLLKCFKRY
jgi:retron-type reverse transcriptase